MIEVALLGVVIGFLSGLVPGIHTNLIAVLVVSFQADGFLSSVFLVAVAVSRSISDTLPTIFLGASDDVLSLLPSHQLLKKGKGLEAVFLSVAGSLFGCLASVALLPLFVLAFPFLVMLVKPVLFWLLLAGIFVLFLQERKIWGVIIFVFAGVLGIVTLSSVQNPLFPLLSGLFGASGLVLSIKNRSVIPTQRERSKVKGKSLLSSLVGAGAAAVMLLFPGLGPSQAASLVAGKRSPSSFLVLTGALGTADVVLSLAALAVAGKARNGAVVMIQSLLGTLSFSTTATLLGASLAAAGLATIGALLFAPVYARLFEYFDYSVLCCIVLAFLFVLVMALSGWRGILVFVTATALGTLAPLKGVRRSHAMGCLLIPTLVALW
ncbi:tripartite tricarboxylate transporter permease [Candidatus Woesearchaeota archaeon]|nr:tripartite tricarboxylate transporter permease [Candidatus Woesearchaeota archaeon]